MAITVKFYGKGLLAIAKQQVDVVGLTTKLTLHTSSYTPDLDAHDFRDDLTNELANGNGYSTGGVTVTNDVWAYDATSNQVRYDLDDIAWTFTAAKTWRYGVLQVVRGGAASADELIALLDWGSDQTVSTAYTLQMAAAGLLYLDAT